MDISAYLQAVHGTTEENVMITYATALSVHGIQIPEHLTKDAEVPTLTGLQAQGDIVIIPTDTVDTRNMLPVPSAGIQVINGESAGNTHWLDAGFDSPGVMWSSLDNQDLGILHVPNGQCAVLTHTDEHGANAMGPGTYILRRQREQADQIQYVID